MSGMAALDVLKNIGSELLGDKLMMDIPNPLDLVRGFPLPSACVIPKALANKFRMPFPI